MTMHVDIVGAEANIFSGQANMVFAPGAMGELGIAPRHTQLITHLKPGAIRIEIEGQDDQFFFINGGVLEVQPNAVTVLADTAMRGSDLSEAAAEEARKRAEDALADKKDDLDLAKAQSELLEAVAQLRTLEKMRKNATH